MSVTITPDFAKKSTNPVLRLEGTVSGQAKSVVLNRDTYILVMMALANPTSAADLVAKSVHYKGGAPVATPQPEAATPTPAPQEATIPPPKSPAPSEKRPAVGQCVISATKVVGNGTYHLIEGTWWHYTCGGSPKVYAYRKVQTPVLPKLLSSVQASAPRPEPAPTSPSLTVVDASSGLKGYYLHMSDGTVRSVDKVTYEAACEELTAAVA